LKRQNQPGKTKKGKGTPKGETPREPAGAGVEGGKNDAQSSKGKEEKAQTWGEKLSGAGFWEKRGESKTTPDPDF